MGFSERRMVHQLGSAALFVLLLPFLLILSANKGTPTASVDLAIQANQTESSALEDVRKAFRSSYSEAIAFHRAKVISKYPIITQDLLNMTLIRSDGTKARYNMNRTTYFLMANTSHPPLTIYSILSRDGFGTLSKEAVVSLEEYSEKLSRGELEVRELSVDPNVKTRLSFVLTSSIHYIQTVIRDRKTSLDQFERYVTPLRRSIADNLDVGASEQLNQFKQQVEKWRLEFPNEKWKELRVVVLGFHQGREQYALRLLFQWLLHEPKYEERIVSLP